MKTGVGDPLLEASRQCGYIPPDGEQCDHTADIHAAVMSPESGLVGIPTCHCHWSIVADVGEIASVHQFGPGCAHPVSRWSEQGCMPDMVGG